MGPEELLDMIAAQEGAELQDNQAFSNRMAEGVEFSPWEGPPQAGKVSSLFEKQLPEANTEDSEVNLAITAPSFINDGFTI